MVDLNLSQSSRARRGDEPKLPTWGSRAKPWSPWRSPLCPRWRMASWPTFLRTLHGGKTQLPEPVPLCWALAKWWSDTWLDELGVWSASCVVTITLQHWAMNLDLWLLDEVNIKKVSKLASHFCSFELPYPLKFHFGLSNAVGSQTCLGLWNLKFWKTSNRWTWSGQAKATSPASPNFSSVKQLR